MISGAVQSCAVLVEPTFRERFRDRGAQESVAHHNPLDACRNSLIAKKVDELLGQRASKRRADHAEERHRSAHRRRR